MHDAIDASLVQEWARMAAEALGETRAEIDALNVFPVPDGDTGTNLFLTVEAAAEAVAQLADDCVDVTTDSLLDAFASGALLGARGNSGVITSQILRGIASAIAADGPGVPPSVALSAALARASELADQAVAEPKEGTVLTVARESARVLAERVDTEMSLFESAEIALAAAQEALERTPEQLPVLKEAGVVDSGGRGYVVLLESLVDAIRQEKRSREQVVLTQRSVAPQVEGHTVTYGGPGFEVMYLLRAEDDAVPALKETLRGLGDSLVVVGGNGLWNIHVHTDDIGGSIEAGIVAGTPYRIKVTHLELAKDARRSGEGSVPTSERAGRGIVAVCHGAGVAGLLEESGVTTVFARPGRRPSTAELLDGVRRTGCAEVVILPSDGDTRVVAEAAAEQARNDGVRTAVIPTRSVVQSLAAVAVHQSGALFDDDIVSMGRAAGSTRYGAVTVAVRKAMTSAGVCDVGDSLGLVGGDIVEIRSTLGEAAIAVIDRLVGSDGELLTVVAGQEATADLLDAISEYVDAQFPEVEIDIVAGGQPLWPVIFGVE